MISTLAAMQISSHPQPALIYLVPAVLMALWGTAAVRGEIKEMWNFSDAAEDGEETKGKENEKKDGKDGGKQDSGSAATEKKSSTCSSIFSNERAEERAKAIDKYFTAGSPTTEQESTAGGSDKSVPKAHRGQTLFSLSIVAPPPYWSNQDESSKESSKRADETGEIIKEVSTTPHEAGEHVEKKRRIN